MAKPKHLLETCAMKIVERLHEEFNKIEKIQITVKKLAPPITNFTGSVGVSICKEFK
jgi:dihydroneopterin aldolase